MMSTLFPSPLDTNLARLAREMDRAFGARQRTERTLPALNAWKTADGFVVEAEIPGFRIEDVEVYAEGDTLTLRAERTDATPDGTKALRTERTASRFDRTLRLPAEIDTDRIGATLSDGVLRITLPLAEHAKPKRIEVRTADALPSPDGN
ncbi:MAG: Hsp20/alpha crystallin family protein [Planctomycetota bacterium]